jgi:hypothetical protein
MEIELAHYVGALRLGGHHTSTQQPSIFYLLFPSATNWAILRSSVNVLASV